MYEEIIKIITSESQKIQHVKLEPKKVREVENTAKQLSNSITKIEPLPLVTISNEKPKEEKRRIPIVKSANNRMPSKRVDFDNDIPWL